MELTTVESSNIAAIGYEGGKLHVRFKDGAEYQYADVTAEQHAALMAAPSKGRWLKEFRSGKKVGGESVPDKSVEETIREIKGGESDWSFAVVR